MLDGGWTLEAGGWTLEAGGWGMGAGGWDGDSVAPRTGWFSAFCQRHRLHARAVGQETHLWGVGALTKFLRDATPPAAHAASFEGTRGAVVGGYRPCSAPRWIQSRCAQRPAIWQAATG